MLSTETTVGAVAKPTIPNQLRTVNKVRLKCEMCELKKLVLARDNESERLTKFKMAGDVSSADSAGEF